jgi:hypothetical protein
MSGLSASASDLLAEATLDPGGLCGGSQRWHDRIPG